MKNVIFTLLILVASSLSFSQDNVSSIYLVGKFGYSDYPVSTRDIKTDNNFKVEGKRCTPAFYTYLFNKKSYIGGMLIDMSTNDTTVITDITLELNSDGYGKTFTVTGEDFSKTMVLQTGYILEEKTSYSVFENDGENKWKITKK